MNQEGIEVIVLFDNFQPNVNNNKSLDECLDWVIWLEYTNVIVAFANVSEEFTNKLHNKWSKKIKRLKIINVPNCQSANDVLRDLQNSDIIKSDFLLIHNGIALSSSNLATEIENFKIKRKQNKNMMATIFFEETKSNLKGKMLTGYQSTTKKLLYYNLKGQKGKMNIPKSTFLNETTFRKDLKPIGLWLCGHEFSGHFAGSDTHDFHTLEDILQNILNNEEFLCQEIYVEILPANSTIKNVSENEEEAAESSEEEEVDEESSDGKIDDGDEYEEEIDVIYQGNNAAFLSQVLELMQDFVEINKEKDIKKGKSANEEQFEQLKLEINGLKFANNISVEEMPRLLFLAFLRIPKTDKWLSTFKELFNEWSNFWLVYFKKTNAKVGILHAIEEFALENEQFLRIIPNLLHWLNQEKEFIDDEQIVEWYSSLQKDSPLCAIPKLAEFIQWLKEAEEEEDDENEED